METTMYNDHALRPANSTISKLKANMSLDFENGKKSKYNKLNSILASPDVQLLKLASPELERLIIQQNGLVTTTPTPTKFLCPKNVTEEQEAYARGFVDALAQLHEEKGNGDSDDDDEGDEDAMEVGNPNLTSLPITTVNTAFLPGLMARTVQSTIPTSICTIPRTVETSQLVQHSTPRYLMHVKEEPQTVPCLGNTPPLSPINMENQERCKLERKRARNRVAARKCRTRKLERISHLEDKVAELKGHNLDLSQTASQLRDEICRLKQQIMDHVQSGCQVHMAQSVL